MVSSSAMLPLKAYAISALLLSTKVTRSNLRILVFLKFLTGSSQQSASEWELSLELDFPKSKIGFERCKHSSLVVSYARCTFKSRTILHWKVKQVYVCAMAFSGHKKHRVPQTPFFTSHGTLSFPKFIVHQIQLLNVFHNSISIPVLFHNTIAGMVSRWRCPSQPPSSAPTRRTRTRCHLTVLARARPTRIPSITTSRPASRYAI